LGIDKTPSHYQSNSALALLRTTLNAAVYHVSWFYQIILCSCIDSPVYGQPVRSCLKESLFTCH